ncbi:tetratricopeptide repeat protein 8 [Stomoxys calcitrans]|uniref:tetratricopeptide repeat protein 8 n=1 Tax=Stomoxys calcitrans TaxID=35570 RepID=UPI0027E27502|nr:tetratricopeptide repeat protein 8 [Stomoxys calcitrans]
MATSSRPAAFATTRHSKEFKTNLMNNDDDIFVNDDEDEASALPPPPAPAPAQQQLDSSSSTLTSTTTSLSAISGLLQSAAAAPASVEKSLATLELQYFKAVSLYRRRNYEKCVEVCNAMLQAGHENNVQMFHTPPDEEDEDDSTSPDQLVDFKNNANGVGNINNSSNGNNVQRYGSKLQRMGAIKGRPHQRGIYGNNVATNAPASPAIARAPSSSATTAPAGSGTGAVGAAAASFSILPTWMMEGVWQLKMRALTQRIYIDDLETNDADDAVNEEVEFERIATTARPRTSIKTAFVPRPSTSTLRSSTALSRGESGTRRMLTSSMSSRPTSGIARPGTSGLSRPGSSLGGRPASRCGTASRVRATSAAAYTIGDATAPLYQASRLNPTIYAERKVLVKALFQFLYYHEADVLKAYSLCEAVIDVHKQKRGSSASLRSLASCDEWWWQQQMGRCLLALKYPRKAESFLHQSLANFPHPDTYVLLSRLYQRLDQNQKAMDLIQSAVDKHPFDVTFRIEQGRLLDVMSQSEDSMQMYRLIAKLNPINVEALACIALNYFYDNNPEMALMYYRRILSLGVHSAELYCNIGLCCLYGGQIELVLPCFQRALLTAKTSEQKADIWYNLSFVAITTGDFNLAKRCLQLCLTSDARNGAALNNLSVLAAYTGDILKSKSYLNAAKDVMPDSQEIKNNLKYMDEHYKL